MLCSATEVSEIRPPLVQCLFLYELDSSFVIQLPVLNIGSRTSSEYPPCNLVILGSHRQKMLGLQLQPKLQSAIVAASWALPRLVGGIPLMLNVRFNQHLTSSTEQVSMNGVAIVLVVLLLVTLEHLSQQHPTPDQAWLGLSPNRTCFWKEKAWSGDS